MTDSPVIFVFCALACEARPLIAAWRLKKLASAVHPFAVYADRQRVVVVTGIGKTAMSGAIGYVMALFNNPVAPIMLNLGIAGHGSRALGSICLGHKIVDIESGRSFYPQMPFAVPCSTDVISTQSRPQIRYVEAEVYDMEAAGFYEMAVKFSSCELIQVIKVISDNAQSPIANINEQAVEEWLHSQLGVVEALLERLKRLRLLVVHDGLESVHQQLLERFHFTVSNALKLKILLQRWRLLTGNAEIAWPNPPLKNAKECLGWLESELDGMNFRL